MSYQILAYICQHPIRISNTLPWSGSLLDYDVHYCNHCEASRNVRQERDYAQRNYESRREVREQVRSRGNQEAYYESRRTYDLSRLAYAEDVERRQDRDDRERRAQGRLTAHEESRRYDELEASRRGRHERPGDIYRTRFAEPESYRRESQYRDQGQYRRSSRAYQRGTHADTRGYGYHNTSDPYASSSDGDEDADLDALSNDQLNERLRQLQALQARFRR